jgi:exopolysaccharide biosynthesis protein
MTRFDGGGSSCMWVYDPASSSGKTVNRVSDSKGERSCLNYMLVRLK